MTKLNENGELMRVGRIGNDFERKKTEHLELVVSVKKKEVVPDESLDVQVTIRNKGDISVAVPNATSTSHFKFLLRKASGNDNIHILSEHTAFMYRYGDPIDQPFVTVELEPGGVCSYEIDLAELYVFPLIPDEYEVSVQYIDDSDSIESPPVRLKIVAPKVKSFATHYAPRRRNLALIFANEEADGSTTICQRESHDEKPRIGILHRRVSLEPRRTVEGVASAIELNDSMGVRWFSWLEEEGIGCGVAQSKTLFGQFGPFKLNLTSALLHRTGWQFGNDTAMFLTLGVNSMGKVAAAPVTFPRRDEDTIIPRIIAATSVPNMWTAHHGHDEGRSRLDIVWRDHHEGWSRLIRQTLFPGTLGPAEVLVKGREALVAISMSPVQEEEPRVVDVLFGPSETGKMTFLRVPLAGGSVIEKWEFSTLLDDKGEPPSEWVLASEPLANPFLLVKLGKRLLLLQIDSGKATVLSNTTALNAAHLNLNVFFRFAAIPCWVSPTEGIQYSLGK